MRARSFLEARRIFRLLFVSLAVLMCLSTGAKAGAASDFDGDGKSDYTMIRRTGNNLNWYIAGSSAGFIAQQ
jgi:hypothetical protein